MTGPTTPEPPTIALRGALETQRPVLDELGEHGGPPSEWWDALAPILDATAHGFLIWYADSSTVHGRRIRDAVDHTSQVGLDVATAESPFRKPQIRERVGERIERIGRAVRDADAVTPARYTALIERALSPPTWVHERLDRADRHGPTADTDSHGDVIEYLVARSHRPRVPLDEWMLANIRTVEILASSDSHVEQSYVWETTDGDKIVTDGDTHHSPMSLLWRLAKLADRALEHPVTPEADDWGAWMQEFLMARGERIEVEGERTAAVRRLTSFIQSHAAYPEPEQAWRHNGVWMPQADADVVRVPSRAVSRITDENGCTGRGLQAELEARGKRRGPVKRVTHPDGRITRWWQLDTELAEPREFVGDTRAPTDGGTPAGSDASAAVARTDGGDPQ